MPLNNNSIFSTHSIPGKVILFGEYDCIFGGPALTTVIHPDFEFIVKKNDSKIFKHPFHPESPAGKLLNEHTSQLAGYEVEWKDSYSTPIGVGSSSAQFLGALKLINPKLTTSDIDTKEVLNLYWKTTEEESKAGLRPSGVDVVTQWINKTAIITNEPFSLESIPSWNHSDVVFALVYTGEKMKTHEHLKKLKELKAADFLPLRKITEQAKTAFLNSDVSELSVLMRNYQFLLTKMQLADSAFYQKIETIQKQPGVLAAKGAGAQGGDCILILIEKKKLKTHFPEAYLVC